MNFSYQNTLVLLGIVCPSLTFADIASDSMPSFATIEQQLNHALIKKNHKKIKELLAEYQKYPKADQILVGFAQGVIWRHEGNLKKAIPLYQDLYRKHPELLTVQLDLAAMLYENKQYKDSKELFNAALLVSPESVHPKIKNYLGKIDIKQSWDIFGNIDYISDSNINNVSPDKIIYFPQYPGIPFTKKKSYLPQKAHGFTYNIAAYRDINFLGNNNISFGASLDGAYYWDNKGYNDLKLHSKFGYLYQSQKVRFSFIPFAERYYYGNKHRYTAYGVESSFSQNITPYWKFFSNITYKYKSYSDNNKGSVLNINLGKNFYPTARMQLKFALDYERNIVDNNLSQSSRSMGASISWTQLWTLGNISSSIAIHASRRKYASTDWIFTDVVRQDITNTVKLSLWKHDWQFLGITPKVNWHLTTVQSNIPSLYSYSKNNIFLSFEKVFN